ncbi:MAG TPA: hypothetical protein VNN22_11715 [Verrucomicrobiae bacterium]|nr:hypothetical protein [Verrucomicrobiae bacterium]
MKRTVPAANPEAYVAALDGWRQACVMALRKEVRAAAKLEEVIKWVTWSTLETDRCC